MRSSPAESGAPERAGTWRSVLPWFSGLLLAPLWLALFRVLPPTAFSAVTAIAAGSALAPVPGLLLARRHQKRLVAHANQAEEEAARLKLQLDTVRYRTARLREDLSAADQQARLGRQLALLGQFTAGFMHEFNNPLSIVAGRVEALLEERQDDAALCTDLRQILHETRYMGNIAKTLLQALRRERGAQGFDPSIPGDALREAVGAMTPPAEKQGVQLIQEIADAPRVNLPGHVVSEVLRGLVANALQALDGRADGVVWIRIEPYRTAGSKVALRVEDNGPGVPEIMRDRIFEPFLTLSPGRERLGLGLFLAASLLDMYDGLLRYEPRSGGGACFVLEMPPARFVRGQPYHWFTGGPTE